MELKPGTRLRSQTCSAEVIVVRPPDRAVDLRCGGAPMVSVDGTAEAHALDAAIAAGRSSGSATPTATPASNCSARKPARGPCRSAAPRWR